jgi:hypothetical protein
VIGPLDPYRTGTGYEVTPVLATIPRGLTLSPSEEEVAEWFAPPASHVLAPENIALKPYPWQGTVHRIVDFHWQGAASGA